MSSNNINDSSTLTVRFTGQFSFKKNKDFFSFDATIDLSNFDNKLHKINNVQKIEDKEQIKKIRKLMKLARNNKQVEKRI